MRTTDFFDNGAATAALKKEGVYVQNIAVEESRDHNVRITLRKGDCLLLESEYGLHAEVGQP